MSDHPLTEKGSTFEVSFSVKMGDTIIVGKSLKVIKNVSMLRNVFSASQKVKATRKATTTVERYKKDRGIIVVELNRAETDQKNYKHL
jgi:hypothetical protein